MIGFLWASASGSPVRRLCCVQGGRILGGGRRTSGRPCRPKGGAMPPNPRPPWRGVRRRSPCRQSSPFPVPPIRDRRSSHNSRERDKARDLVAVVKTVLKQFLVWGFGALWDQRDGKAGKGLYTHKGCGWWSDRFAHGAAFSSHSSHDRDLFSENNILPVFPSSLSSSPLCDVRPIDP